MVNWHIDGLNFQFKMYLRALRLFNLKQEGWGGWLNCSPESWLFLALAAIVQRFFFYFSSDGFFVWQSRIVFAILIEDIIRNLHVKLF